MKNLYRNSKKTKTKNSKLLEKLEKVEEFYTEISNKKKEKLKNLKQFPQSELGSFNNLIMRYSQYHFLIENNIKIDRLRTFSNYFDIFSTYADGIINHLARAGIEKRIKIEIKTEFTNQKLQLSILIKNITYFKEDSVLHNLRHIERSSGHLLTPFQGKVSHYLKKSPNRTVKSLLIKMELSPLRQHIPNYYFINH